MTERERQHGARDDRQILDAWDAAEPPAGFADRVLAAREGSPNAAAEPPRPWKRHAMRVAAVTAVGAAAAVALWHPGDPEAVESSGRVVAQGRETVELGSRGVAVLEPDTAIEWAVRPDGAARIEQGVGNAFYRVERGEPFEVVTPAGTASVHGTSFRVEVVKMRIGRQGAVGMAAGAALATAVVVTVYEGRVALANDGERTMVEAGQRAWTREGRPPSEPSDAVTPSALALALGEEGDDDEAALLDDDTGDLSAGELRERNAALREAHREQTEQMAALRTRLEQLERDRDESDAQGLDEALHGQWFPPDPATLTALAQRCALRVDSPPVFGVEPGEVGEGEDRLDLTDAERRAVNDAIERIHRQFTSELRALYVEATGDAEGAGALSPRAMLAEIQDKAVEGEVGRVMQAIAEERAGMRPPPGDLRNASPAERALRAMAGLGDRMQTVLARSLGPERAYELRAEAGGWPWNRSAFTGCNR